jgi:hypothetical protein
MRINRSLLSIGGFAYAAFHAVLGFLWLESYSDPQTAVMPLVIYLILITSTILFYRGVRIPLAQAIITVAGAQFIPMLAQLKLDPSHFVDYSTWYVMGIGTLLSAVSIRGHIWLAAIGMALATLQITAWAGLENFFATGLLGAIMLFVGSSVINAGLVGAQVATQRYAQSNEQEAAETAAVAVAGEQRALLMRATLARSEELLSVIAAGQPLSEAQRFEARLVEAGLRDEIRGREMMSRVTREAIASARRRGVSVTVLDEGGLHELSHEQRSSVLQQISDALEGLTNGRVTIRAPKNEDWAATVAAFEPGSTTPKLWLRIKPNSSSSDK